MPYSYVAPFLRSRADTVCDTDIYLIYTLALLLYCLDTRRCVMADGRAENAGISLGVGREGWGGMESKMTQRLTCTHQLNFTFDCKRSFLGDNDILIKLILTCRNNHNYSRGARRLAKIVFSVKQYFFSHCMPPKSQFLTAVRNRASVVQRRSL